jgi:hypothetical protein
LKLKKRPELPLHLQESYTRDGSIQKAIAKRIEALEKNATPPDLKGFTRMKRGFIHTMAAKRLQTPDLQRMYIDTIAQTRQLFARPEVTDLEFDLFSALDQPELLEAYGKWEYPRGGRGFEANPTCAKALMTLVALGSSPHVRSVRKSFLTQHGLQQVFAHLENKWAAIAGRDPKPCKTPDYTVSLDQIAALSSTRFERTLLKANIEMFKGMIELHPGEGICELAVEDGTDFTAWCEQVGNDHEEGFDEDGTPLDIRKEVGARYYGPRTEKVVGPDGKEVTVMRGHEKFWRGYYLVALTCVKTGLPIVWTLRNAALDEVEATSELLDLLYELWPDCPLKTIVADKAWDESKLVETCLVNYGVHLVALQDERTAGQRTLTIDQHKNISGYYRDGRVVCRHHGEPMLFKGSEFAKRDGLMPGEPASRSEFRMRFLCEQCGKSYSISPKGFGGENGDWNVLTHFPRNPLGQPKRYAQRRAYETRRNTAEMTFASLKTICQLGLKGASRTRLTDYDTIATLIALSFTIRNAQALAGERIKKQIYPSSFPADLLGGREMYTS